MRYLQHLESMMRQSSIRECHIPQELLAKVLDLLQILKQISKVKVEINLSAHTSWLKKFWRQNLRAAPGLAEARLHPEKALWIDRKSEFSLVFRLVTKFNKG